MNIYHIVAGINLALIAPELAGTEQAYGYTSIHLAAILTVLYLPHIALVAASTKVWAINRAVPCLGNRLVLEEKE